MVLPRCWKRSFCVLLLCFAGVRDATGGVLTLTWDPSQDSSVAGYMVFVGTESGKYSTTVDIGNQLQFVFRDAQPGSTYYFAVAAYRSDGVMGPRSAEVSTQVDVSFRLSNPGTQTSALGTRAILQLAVSGPAAGPLTYTASGLPPGMAIDNATGLIAGTPSIEGSYRVVATVTSGSNAATESFLWTVPGRPVPQTPVVTVAIPSDSPNFTTSEFIVLIGGTASDDHGVSAVYWTNARGGSGRATGTEEWVAAVLLRVGKNDITITAVDGDSNQSQRRLTIYRKWVLRGRPAHGPRPE